MRVYHCMSTTLLQEELDWLKSSIRTIESRKGNNAKIYFWICWVCCLSGVGVKTGRSRWSYFPLSGFAPILSPPLFLIFPQRFISTLSVHGRSISLNFLSSLSLYLLFILFFIFFHLLLLLNNSQLKNNLKQVLITSFLTKFNTSKI